MYESKMAAAIKVKGKVLREFKDTVYIPFGSEYSILLKNLNTKRAVVNIFIDGQTIVENGLVLNAGQEIDLERFVKNGNLTEGNRLKFIERTSSVEQHRGVKLEDGIVRIEYQFESPPVSINTLPSWQVNSIMRGHWPGSISASGSTGYPIQSTYCSTTSASVSANAFSASVNDAGITVPGSKSSQTFTTTYMGAMEPEKFSMVFRLLGGEAVKEAVTVKHKPKCVTCGTQNKAHAKFCHKCGTSLEIFA